LGFGPCSSPSKSLYKARRGMTRIHYAVAVCNFTPSSAQIEAASSLPYPFLDLTIGDEVHLLAEEEDWAFGCKTSHPSQYGLFPMQFVGYPEMRILESENWPLDRVIAADIKDALTKWWPKISAAMCSESDVHYLKELLDIMDKLRSIRKRIEAELIPSTRLNVMRKEVSYMIDKGAAFLKLPLQIRDDDDRPFEQGDLSITECFNQYIKKHKSLSVPLEDAHGSGSLPKSLLLDIRNSTLNLFSNAEYSMGLYDLTKKRYVTDIFSFIWIGTEKRFEKGAARCIFTNLDQSLDIDKVVLITRVARLAPVDNTSGTLIKKLTSSADRNPVHNCRQPIAFDIRDLRSILPKGRSGNAQHVAAILNREDSFDVSLEKWSMMMKLPRGEGSANKTTEDATLHFTVVLLEGSRSKIMHTNSHLFIDRKPTEKKCIHLHDLIKDEERNELLVTLLYGEFLTKAVDKKNIEIRLSLVDKHDRIIPGCFDIPGPSRSPAPTHCSYVYINEDKPKWNETVKVRLPTIVPDDCLFLRMCYHVRRSVDKHKSEKGPFALSYLKILDSGEIIQDKEHEPYVYKIDQSRYETPNADYITLPSARTDIRDIFAVVKHSQGVFSLSDKCSMTVSTHLVSSRIPMSPNLRKILHHSKHSADLASSLTYFSVSCSENEEELVRFAPKIVESLFDIWDTHQNLEQQVFSVLVNLLSIHEQKQFVKCRARIVEVAERTWHTSAAFRILRCLTSLLTLGGRHFHAKRAMDAMKSLSWFATVISESNRKGIEAGVNCADACTTALETFMTRVTDLVSRTEPSFVDDKVSLATVQNTVIRHLPELITPLIMTPKESKRFSTLSNQSEESKDSDRTGHLIDQQCELLKECRGMYDANKLTEHLHDIIQNCSPFVADMHRISYVDAIIRTPLFMMESCREVLLTPFLTILLKLMELDDLTANDEKRTQVSTQCFKTLLMMIEKLFPTKEHGGFQTGTANELEMIVTTSLRTSVRTAVFVSNGILPYKVDDARSHAYTLVITLLHHTSATTFKKYIASHNEAKVEVILEMLLMVRDILNKSPFCVTWVLLNREMNRVVYQVLQYVQAIHKTLIDVTSFVELWREYMLSLIAFIIHASAKDNTPAHFESEELVKNAMFELRSTWFMLSPAQKMRHIPHMIRDFLLVAITTKSEHGEIIKILCDMMMTEYSLSDAQPRNFNQTSRELYLQLDSLIVQETKGNRSFRELLIHFMEQNLSQDPELWEVSGQKFVVEVDRVLNLLFDYRLAKEREDNEEQRMRCIVLLLQVYQDSDQAELSIRYVYTLFDLHISCGYYIEAANTLKIHAESMLSWSNTELPEYLVTANRNRNCATERQLKAVLLADIAELYEKGELYEEAIHNYNKIMPHYERIVVDYRAMARITNEVGKLYNKIEDGTRVHPFFYLVGFYGLGFGILNGKQYVYMSKATMRLGDFCTHLKKAYPLSALVDSSANTEKLKTSSGRHFQVMNLTAVPNQYPFEAENVSESIKMYYEYFHIQKFEYTKAFKNKESKWLPYATNDTAVETAQMFTSKIYVVPNEEMPGILNFSKVISISDPIIISPLQMALTQMVEKNEALYNSAKKYRTSQDSASVQNLERQVLGICQAAVMGGVANYLIFFAPELEEGYDDNEKEMVEKLRALIIRQVVLVEYAVFHHKGADPKLHEHLVNSFRDHRAFVEKQFGAVEDSIIPSDATLDEERRESLTMSVLTLNEPSQPSTITRKMKHLRKSTNILTQSTSMLQHYMPSKSPRESVDAQSFSLMSPASPSSSSLTTDTLFSPSPSSRLSSRSLKGESNGVEEAIDKVRNFVTTPIRKPKLPSGPPPPLPEKPGKIRESKADDSSSEGSQSHFGTLRSKTFFTPKNKPLPPTPSEQ
ncbi:ced-5, partial [Pristionchus pacificus]